MRPDSLHHTTHYRMSDYRHRDSTERAAPDQLALQVWADGWDDAHIPRTDTPVRFRYGVRYVRSTFGTLEAVVPFSRISR